MQPRGKCGKARCTEDEFLKQTIFLAYFFLTVYFELHILNRINQKMVLCLIILGAEYKVLILSRCQQVAMILRVPSQEHTSGIVLYETENGCKLRTKAILDLNCNCQGNGAFVGRKDVTQASDQTIQDYMKRSIFRL